MEKKIPTKQEREDVPSIKTTRFAVPSYSDISTIPGESSEVRHRNSHHHHHHHNGPNVPSTVSVNPENEKEKPDTGADNTLEPDIVSEGHPSNVPKVDVGHDGDTTLSQAVQERSSFGELVMYNNLGEPYIDINRLVYKPKPKMQAVEEEDSIWYWPDYVFLLCNFISALGSSYLFLVGTTAVSWISSINSVISANPSSNSKAILRSGLKGTSPTTIGLILIGVGMFNIVNVVLGTHAIVVGYKTVLAQHVVADIALVAAELTLGGIMSTSSARCSQTDLNSFESIFEEYIKTYATSEPENTTDDIKREHRVKEIQLDNIQIALSCCGSRGWGDYLNASYIGTTKKFNLDTTELVFPVSCCRPWWVRNVYCAADAHLLALPGADANAALMFRQRINQEGCISKLKSLCDNVLYFMGPGMLIVGSLHFLLVCGEGVAAFYHIRDILVVVRARKKQTKHDDTEYDEDSDFSNDNVLISGNTMKTLSAVDELKAHLPSPTEDQINLIKARSDFNTFEARVKRTQIGKWMSLARATVNAPDLHNEGTDENHPNSPQTE